LCCSNLCAPKASRATLPQNARNITVSHPVALCDCAQATAWVALRLWTFAARGYGSQERPEIVVRVTVKKGHAENAPYRSTSRACPEMLTVKTLTAIFKPVRLRTTRGKVRQASRYSVNCEEPLMC
jgi:hypothetical protein